MLEWFQRLLKRQTVVNDVHSALNLTRVSSVARPKTTREMSELVRRCRDKGGFLAISGGRHSMGGQQFLADSLLLDTRSCRSLSHLDVSSGKATVGAGVFWPQLYRELERAQSGDPFRWTYRQKQTGGDRLSLGGSLASNIHSRGLAMAPMVEDVESMVVVKPNGEVVRVSRTENADLWPLVIGGYGLFGIVSEVELRLVRRHKVRRRVEVRPVEGLISAFQDLIASGYEFGDFQFAIDPRSEDFLRQGVFACYEPVEDREEIPSTQKEVPRRAWHHLVYLAHTDKSEAFRLYADFYKSTDGQVYWSDLHQMTPYLDGYHRRVDRLTRARCKGSEMITELYLPRESLEGFLDLCRRDLRESNANVIYGTIRLVEPDTETFLAWATQNWACVIFNLHVDHDQAGIERAAAQFQRLIDHAQAFGGSFYLTYHRWASKQQIERSYPQMPEFLRLKREHDPAETLQSEWYRHIKSLFALA